MAQLLVFIFIVALVLGLWALVWLVWCAVLGAMWPTGPVGFISPSYWVFVGFLVLIAFLAGFFRSEK